MAVIPLIVAYIGGKNVNGGKDVILMLNNIKTTKGITIETTIIKDLYFKVWPEFSILLINQFFYIIA